MKKNILLITLAAVALFTACQKKVLSEQEKLDSRTVSTLEVQYVLDGSEVQALNFGHSYTLCELAVNVNNEGLIWNVESSNTSWCKVLPGEHRGSGKVTLELAANDRFIDRMDANLTFVAGDFRGFTIPVSQTAATFIVGQPYFVAGPGAAAYEVEVTTLTEKADWNFESQSDWLGASIKSTGAPVDGKVTKILSLTAAANNEPSRLGFVNLTYGAEKDALSIWQYGTDFDYDGDMIFFPSDAPAKIHFVAPTSVIKKATLPDFCSQQVETMGDDREKWTISFAEHLSDCSEMRDTVIRVTLSNNVSLALPRVEQDYVPAHGLTSAKGVQFFAQKVAAGESIADWQNEEGWVTMLNDIDMTGVTAWAGIGTTTHPFSGKFDGKGKSITNLKQSASGFFNVCAGEGSDAYIQGLTIGKSCTFVHPADKPSTEAFGGIVNYASNARIIDCSNLAPITFQGTGSGTAVLGGIIGQAADGVTIRGCHMEGLMTVACTASTAQVGGVAGNALAINKCDFTGSIVTEGATLSAIYAGGITSRVYSTKDVFNNAFAGTIEAKSTNVSSHYLGGLYATTASDATLSFDKEKDMSSVSGSIRISGFKNDAAAQLYAGGFIGFVDAGATLSFKGYSPQTSFYLDETTTNKAYGCCIGGIIGGCSPDGPVASLTFDHITTMGDISLKYADGVKHAVVRNLFGGLAGFIYGPASFQSCVNNMTVGAVVEGSAENDGGNTTNNSHFISMGGLLGYAEGGDLNFVSCQNKGAVTNLGYVNNVAPSTTLGSAYSQGQCAGGVLGGFDIHATPKGGKLTMSYCENNAKVASFRGVNGGLIGFCQNAKLVSCNSKATVDKDKGNAFIQGGIAGLVLSGSFEGCTAKCDVRVGNGGSSLDNVSVGGILARVYNEGVVSIKNCSYYGSVNVNNMGSSAAKPLYQGGLVGVSSANTTISGCRYGGHVAVTTVNEDNFLSLAIGNGLGTQQETRLWDGN